MDSVADEEQKIIIYLIATAMLEHCAHCEADADNGKKGIENR